MKQAASGSPSSFCLFVSRKEGFVSKRSRRKTRNVCLFVSRKEGFVSRTSRAEEPLAAAQRIKTLFEEGQEEKKTTRKEDNKKTRFCFRNAKVLFKKRKWFVSFLNSTSSWTRRTTRTAQRKENGSFLNRRTPLLERKKKNRSKTRAACFKNRSSFLLLVSRTAQRKAVRKEMVSKKRKFLFCLFVSRRVCFQEEKKRKEKGCLFQEPLAACFKNRFFFFKEKKRKGLLVSRTAQRKEKKRRPGFVSETQTNN